MQKLKEDSKRSCRNNRRKKIYIRKKWGKSLSRRKLKSLDCNRKKKKCSSDKKKKKTKNISTSRSSQSNNIEWRPRRKKDSTKNRNIRKRKRKRKLFLSIDLSLRRNNSQFWRRLNKKLFKRSIKKNRISRKMKIKSKKTPKERTSTTS